MFIKYNFSGASRFIDDRDGTSWQRSQGPEHSQVSEFTAISYLTWEERGWASRQMLHTYFGKRKPPQATRGKSTRRKFRKGGYSPLEPLA